MRARANRIARASAVPESAEPGATSGSCRMALFHCWALDTLPAMMDYRSSGPQASRYARAERGYRVVPAVHLRAIGQESRTTCTSGGVLCRIVVDDLLRWTVCETDRSNYSRADTRFRGRLKYSRVDAHLLPRRLRAGGYDGLM